jgi:hypothetical protein
LEEWAAVETEGPVVVLRALRAVLIRVAEEEGEATVVD